MQDAGAAETMDLDHSDNIAARRQTSATMKRKALIRNASLHRRASAPIFQQQPRKKMSSNTEQRGLAALLAYRGGPADTK